MMSRATSWRAGYGPCFLFLTFLSTKLTYYLNCKSLNHATMEFQGNASAIRSERPLRPLSLRRVERGLQHRNEDSRRARGRVQREEAPRSALPALWTASCAGSEEAEVLLGFQVNFKASMNLDQNAAAFGVFHLTFANLTQHLAAALFYIRQLREPDLKFEDVFKLKFSRLLKEFEKELKQLDGGSHDMELQALRPVCERIKALGDWRNARIHPRVQI